MGEIVLFDRNTHTQYVIDSLNSNPKYILKTLKKGLKFSRYVPSVMLYPFVPLKGSFRDSPLLKKQYRCLTQCYEFFRVIDDIVDGDFEDERGRILQFSKYNFNELKKQSSQFINSDTFTLFPQLFEEMKQSMEYLTECRKEEIQRATNAYFESFEFDFNRYGSLDIFSTNKINWYYSRLGEGFGGLLTAIFGNLDSTHQEDLNFAVLNATYYEYASGLLSTQTDAKKGVINVPQEIIREHELSLEDIITPDERVRRILKRQSHQELDKLPKTYANAFQRSVIKWYQIRHKKYHKHSLDK